jgi:hypothetical protein
MMIGSGFGIRRLCVAAHDEMGEVVRREGAEGPVVDLAAGAHDDHAIGERDHIPHVVADQDDCATGGLELADQVEDEGGLLDAECRRRLVHDDDVGIPAQRARDRYSLPLAAGEAFHRPVHVGDRDRQLRQVALRLRAHPLLVKHTDEGQHNGTG